ncbi:P-loop containing nucleoside triphosphate hydrolase protein, partial [Ephemerocybe angulata]
TGSGALSDLSVPYEVFDSAHPDSLASTTANIVLVSADKANWESWRHALARLSQSRVLIRFVIDEAHLWITDASFRPGALETPGGLRAFPMQMVLLSATVSPAIEASLRTQFVLQNPSVIRCHPHRPELLFDIPEQTFRSTQAMVTKFNDRIAQDQSEEAWHDNDRWLGFVPSIPQGLEVSAALSVEFYSSQDSPDERAAKYSRWLKGTSLGMVATTAISVGTDYPHVRFTCHFGSPHDMTTLIQQTSRAGRDGHPARCLVLPSNPPLSPPKAPLEPEKAALSSLLYPSRDAPLPCFSELPPSVVLTSPRGGKLVLGALQAVNKSIPGSPDRVSVDPPHFSPSPSSFPPLPAPPLLTLPALRAHLHRHFNQSVLRGQVQLTDRKAAIELEVEPYKEVLRGAAQSCGACFFRGHLDRSHEVYNCPVIPRRDVLALRSLLKYPKTTKPQYRYLVCYRCHITLWKDNALHCNLRVANPCSHPELMTGAYCHVWDDIAVRQAVEREFDVTWVELDDYARWLVQPHTVHVTNGMALLMRCWKQLQSVGTV